MTHYPFLLLASLAGLVLIAAPACASPGTAPPSATVAPTMETSTPTSTPAPTATSHPAPTPTLAFTPVATQGPETPLRHIPPPPDVDLYDLGRRLQGKTVDRGRDADLIPPVGQQRSFSAVDFGNLRVFQVSATLRHVSQHALFYVQDGIPVTDEALRATAQVFEESIYPSVGRVVGLDWLPERLTILHGRFPQVAGYYSYLDEFPASLLPPSNEQSMIYINTAGPEVGSAPYLRTLAHELQHAAHWRADPSEETWVNEGLSEVAAQEAGYETLFFHSFLSSPGTSLIHWPADPSATRPSYGAATLFFSFLRHRYLDGGALAGLVAQPADGVEGVQRFLADVVPGLTFAEVFQEWALANYLDSRGRPDAYPDIDVFTPDGQIVQEDTYLAGEVPQYAADYLTIQPFAENVHIAFHAEPTTPLLPLPLDPDPAWFWWSNRGDSIDSTLTRQFDLRTVDSATLEMDLWFDIEEFWDYAYLEASTDGGETWTVLETAYTQPDNPVGQAFAPGYTGRSGGGEEPRWITEVVDLSPFAGTKVLVRLEYVTDAAINLDGLAVRRMAVPEIGIEWDGAPNAEGWIADGFVLMTNEVRQTFWVQAVRFFSDGSIEVADVPLSEVALGTTSSLEAEVTFRGLGTRLEKTTLVIMAAAPGTSQPAAYTVTVSKENG